MNASIFLALALTSGVAAQGAQAPATNSGSNAAPAMTGATLNLEAGFTEAQSKQYHEAVEAAREEISGNIQKLRNARRELEKQVTAEKLDEAAIRAKATEVGKLEGDIGIAKSKVLAKLRPNFNQEQLERIARSPQLNGAPFTPRTRNPADRMPRVHIAPTPAPKK